LQTRQMSKTTKTDMKKKQKRKRNNTKQQKNERKLTRNKKRERKTAELAEEWKSKNEEQKPKEENKKFDNLNVVLEKGVSVAKTRVLKHAWSRNAPRYVFGLNPSKS
jgi:hypothetical protein